MIRPWVIVLLAASIGSAARADAPPPASPDVAAEMAWARATWPDGLKPLTVGDELTLETGEFRYEEKDARGRWRRKGGPAIGIMPERYGWLSYVDDRVARWDAEPLRLGVNCKGATEWLACAAGGEHPCERCDQFFVYLESARYESISGQPSLPTGLGNPEIGVKRVATCRDRCPSHPDSPEVARVRELAKRAGFWRDAKTPLAKVPSLYLSRADCLREHPQRARASRDAW